VGVVFKNREKICKKIISKENGTNFGWVKISFFHPGIE
jgi:hypothetical protein